MGLSLGGGYNSQSGNSSGSTTSNQNSTTNQNGNANQTNSGTSSGSTTGSNTVQTTDIFNNAGSNAASLLGGEGLSDGQRQALIRQQGVVQNQPMGFALQGVNGQLDNFMANPNIPSVAGGSANAYTGSQFMSPYEQRYANDVLNPSLALFDQDTGRQMAAMHNARDAGSAFGDRSALADSTFDQNRALARAGVAGNILGQGFNTAVGAGEADAAKALGASVTNASNATTASVANASNALAGRGQDLQALGMKANNDISTDTMGRANNESLFGMGGGGFNNLLSLMGSQTPAFGNLSTGNTNSTFSSIMDSIFSGGSNSFGSSSGTSNNNFNTSGFTKGGGIG